MVILRNKKNDTESTKTRKSNFSSLFYSWKKTEKKFWFGAPTIIGTFTLIVSIFVSIFSWRDSIFNTKASEKQSEKIDFRALETQVADSVMKKLASEDVQIATNETESEVVLDVVPKTLEKPVSIFVRKPIQKSSEEIKIEIPKAEKSIPELEKLEPSKNNPPKIISIPITSVYFGNTLNYAISATDADGDVLSYDFSVSEFNIFSDPRVDSSYLTTISKVIKFTPQKYDIGKTFNFSIFVSDGIDSTSQHFSVLVLDPGVVLSLNFPQDGSVKNVNEPFELQSTAKYAGVSVDWLEDQFFWTIKNNTTGSIFSVSGRDSTISLTEPGDYTITITAEDPEDLSKNYSKSVSIVVL
ncbi:MAG: hypothetical protein Fur0024_0730 [Patescibacteria group bacterium]